MLIHHYHNTLHRSSSCSDSNCFLLCSSRYNSACTSETETICSNALHADNNTPIMIYAIAGGVGGFVLLVCFVLFLRYRIRNKSSAVSPQVIAEPKELQEICIDEPT